MYLFIKLLHVGINLLLPGDIHLINTPSLKIPGSKIIKFNILTLFNLKSELPEHPNLVLLEKEKKDLFHKLY